MYRRLAMTESKTNKRIPSLAFLVTLATGLFWTWFGLTESISGFLKDPKDPTEIFGGLLQALIFGGSFIVIAILLWRRPRIGAWILIALGVAFGIWMLLDWNLENTDPFVLAVLVGLPLGLGAFTLYREREMGTVRETA